MFQKSGVMHKVEEFVEIKLVGQPAFEAVVFLAYGDRLIDLLNDNRSFIPVKRRDNSTIIMSKSNIVSIIEKDPFADDVTDDPIQKQDVAHNYDDDEFEDQAESASEANEEQDEAKTDQSKRKQRRRRKKSKEFDAYTVLKVSPDASLDEIRKVYKSRIKTVHPDTVAALDLGEDLIKAAIQTTQRINYAYHQILKERRKAEAEASSAQGDPSSRQADQATSRKGPSSADPSSPDPSSPDEGQAA